MEYSSSAQSLSDAELLRFSENHLTYEIWMFFKSGTELSRVHFSESDPASLFYKNALVESFVNHLRNLLLFLYPYRVKHGGDVIARCFFVDPTVWKDKAPPETDSLRKARKRASQEISHLTASRRDVTDALKTWPAPDLMAEIKGVLDVFVDNASSTKLHSSVKDLLNKVDLSASPSNAMTTTICASGTPAATNVFGSVSSVYEPPEQV